MLWRCLSREGVAAPQFHQTTEMGKLPAFLFYPNDWRTDPNLCRVSKSARDTWMDMLCLMFFSEERGVLITGDKPWTDEEVAGAIRGDHTANLRDIQLLLEKGVAVRDSRGAIFSKRMVRDEQKRKADVVRQKKSRVCHKHVTPFVTRLSETENETETSLTNTPLVANQTIDAQQATSLVFLELSLAGNEARMLVHDAIKSFMHNNKASPEQAANAIVAVWNDYAKAQIPFKRGVLKFFKEGLWKDKTLWASKEKSWRDERLEKYGAANAR